MRGKRMDERAAGVPGGETATRHATLSADTARRRRYAHPGHRNVGQPIWSLWLSSDHGAAQAGRLEGRQGPGRANLASRGAEGSTEAEAERAVVAQRRVMRAAASTARQSCLELRLRQCEDPCWKDGAHVE